MNTMSSLRALAVATLFALTNCSGPTKTATTPTPSTATPPDNGATAGAATVSTSANVPSGDLTEAQIAALTDESLLPLRADIKKGKLANGLTYYILPHAKPKNRAYLWLAVNAGSMLEDDDQRGLAHLVEHMAFNGTKNYPKSAIVDYLEKIGMSFGADVNAYTSFDQTVYQLEVPTDGKQFVETGLDILREWAGNIAFDAKEVEKERGVVLEEWRLGRGAQSRLFDKSAPVLFAGTRYAERLPIGTPEIIKGAAIDTIKRFYKDWYRPDLMAVIVVGEINPAEIQEMITKRFGDLANPSKARPRTLAGKPSTDGPRVSIVTDKEMPATAITVYNMLPKREELTAGSYRRILSEQLFNLMLNQRLSEVAKTADSPFMMAMSQASGMAREVEALVRVAAAKPGKAEDAMRALFTEVLRAEQFGFTAAEFDRAKKMILRGIEQSATSAETNDGSEFADEITRNFFEGEMMSGRAAEAGLSRKYLPQITVAMVNQQMATWGGDANRAIIINGPENGANRRAGQADF
jgi:zinc protease